MIKPLPHALEQPVATLLIYEATLFSSTLASFLFGSCTTIIINSFSGQTMISCLCERTLKNVQSFMMSRSWIALLARRASSEMSEACWTTRAGSRFWGSHRIGTWRSRSSLVLLSRVSHVRSSWNVSKCYYSEVCERCARDRVEIYQIIGTWGLILPLTRIGWSK